MARGPALVNYVPGGDLGPINRRPPPLPAGVVNCGAHRARGTAIRGTQGGSSSRRVIDGTQPLSSHHHMANIMIKVSLKRFHMLKSLSFIFMGKQLSFKT